MHSGIALPLGFERILKQIYEYGNIPYVEIPTVGRSTRITFTKTSITSIGINVIAIMTLRLNNLLKLKQKQEAMRLDDFCI